MLVTESAKIIYTSAENENGYEVDCVFAECLDSEKRVGPIWGHHTRSVRRALARLTEVCPCAADFHEADFRSGARR